MFNAADCARKAGKFAFGLDETRTVQMLRQLADDIEGGKLALHGVSSTTHAAHDDFTIRELAIEVLEHAPAGPRVIKQNLGQDLPDGFQTAEFLLDHGMVDSVVHRRTLKRTVSQLLRHMSGHPAAEATA